MPDVQASFSVQSPVTIAVVQAPRLQTNPVTQSALEVHVVLQLVASAQARWLAHATGASALQVPLPLQAMIVSVLPLQTFGAHGTSNG
jgi:hypothetical protein